MIRTAKTEELDTILRWHFRNVDAAPGGRAEYARKFPSEYKETLDTLSGKTGFVLVSDIRGQLAGYIGVRLDTAASPTRAYLCGFYVDAQMRHRSQGRALAEAAITSAKELNAASLSVEVGLRKEWLIKFYESVGFMPSSMTMYQELDTDIQKL